MSVFENKCYSRNIYTATVSLNNIITTSQPQSA